MGERQTILAYCIGVSEGVRPPPLGVSTCGRVGFALSAAQSVH